MAVSGEIEDHANNLPHIAQRVRRIVDNLKYILGMEAMHAAQAITLRLEKNPALPLGKATAAAYQEFRRDISWYDADRNISADIEKAYQLIKGGRMLAAARSFGGVKN
jgi:histidine ammonia-lyase